MTLTEFLEREAAGARAVGAEVTIDRRVPTVAIGTRRSDVFMQGDDATEFLANVDRAARGAPELPLETTLLAFALPYL